LYIEALVTSFYKALKTSSIKFFGLLSEPGGDFPFYSFIVGKMFSRKMMFNPSAWRFKFRCHVSPAVLFSAGI
jgi:hypothetical protein